MGSRIRPLLGSRGVSALLGAVAALTLVGGIALATDSPVIHGCYNNTNGNLRVVRSADSCRRHETSISWNRSGPAGPQGPQGPPGRAGVGSVHAMTASAVAVRGPNPFVTVVCPNGERAISGGYSLGDPANAAAAVARVVVSAPVIVATGRPVGWHVQVVNDSATPVRVTTFATCATAAA